MNDTTDLDTALALNRAQALLDSRPDTTVDDLRELLRLTVIVMALRPFAMFARPMGDRGRVLEIEPDPYLPRPAHRIPPRPAQLPRPRLPRSEEFRLRRAD